MADMLTARQEAYVQALVEGMSQREAYRHAFKCPTAKDSTVDQKACMMFKQEKIRKRYRQLVQETSKKALWTREDAINDLIWLKEIAKADIKQKGLKKVSADTMTGTIKELNTLEALYKKDLDDLEDNDIKITINKKKKEVD